MFNTFCHCSPCVGNNNFPALDEDFKCLPIPTNSEIGAVIFLPNGVTPPADWTNEAQWRLIFNQLDTANSSAKIMLGMGSIGEPEERLQKIAKGVERVQLKQWTLEIDTVNISAAFYAFIKYLQCDPKNYRFWFWDMGGYLHGGATGITPYITGANFIRNRGEDSYLIGRAKIQYRNCGCDPDRAHLPTLFDNITNTFNVWGFSPDSIWGFAPSEALAA